MTTVTVSTVWDELKTELNALEAAQMRRSTRSVAQQESATLILDGTSLLNFSSNNYLGLARHPQVIEAVRQVLDHWGVGGTSSRSISGTSVIHEDLEHALAAFMQTEAALLFPTGYMANVGVVTALAVQGDAIVMDRLCHASLIDAAKLSGARLFVYSHGNLDEAERALKRAASYRRRLLISDSLFSMDGDFAPLAELSQLARRYGAVSVLDEAHAVGVWGEGGRGKRTDAETRRPEEHRRGDAETRRHGDTAMISPRLRVPPSPRLKFSASPWDVVVGTLSKALGSQGGFVCGPQTLIDWLVNKSRSFIYTTALSPACVAAAQAALSLIQEDAQPRQRLQDLSKRLREGLQGLGYNTLGSQSQIVPILLGSPEKALACATHLEAQGIFAPAIRPPTVHAGECRIRFSVTAEHTAEDIDRLLNVLKKTAGNRNGGMTATAGKP